MAKGLELTKILEDKTIKGIYFGVIERARQTAEVCLYSENNPIFIGFFLDNKFQCGKRFFENDGTLSSVDAYIYNYLSDQQKKEIYKARLLLEVSTGCFLLNGKKQGLFLLTKKEWTCKYEKYSGTKILKSLKFYPSGNVTSCKTINYYNNKPIEIEEEYDETDKKVLIKKTTLDKNKNETTIEEYDKTDKHLIKKTTLDHWTNVTTIEEYDETGQYALKRTTLLEDKINKINEYEKVETGKKVKLVDLGTIRYDYNKNRKTIKLYNKQDQLFEQKEYLKDKLIKTNKYYILYRST